MVSPTNFIDPCRTQSDRKEEVSKLKRLVYFDTSSFTRMKTIFNTR